MFSFKSVFLNGASDCELRTVLVYCLFDTKKTDLPPPPLFIDYLWVGLVEPGCCLPYYTQREGRAMTRSHAPTHLLSLSLTLTHTHIFIPSLVRAHDNLRSDLAYIIHTAHTEGTPVHTCSSVPLTIQCVYFMTLTR